MCNAVCYYLCTIQRSVWVRHFEMCHIKVKKTKRRKKERDRAVECQQCRCFQHAVTLHVCTRVCVCACVCTSWLPMCLTNNHNLATLPRSRRRHFTLPSPWRSALPHTHTALQCALQTHSLPLRCLWFYLIWPCLASTHFSESIVHRFTSYIVQRGWHMARQIITRWQWDGTACDDFGESGGFTVCVQSQQFRFLIFFLV